MRRKHDEITFEQQLDDNNFLQEGGGEAVPPPPELRYFSNGVGLSGFYNPALIVIKYCPIFKNDDRCENAPMPERPDHAERKKPSGKSWLYRTGTGS